MIKKLISIKNNKEKKILIKYSLSSFLKTFFQVITGIILIKWIQPSEIGIYNSYSIVIAYSFFLQLGIFNGLNRQIPYLLGKNDHDAANKLIYASNKFAILLSASFFIISTIVFISCLIFFNLNFITVSSVSIIILISSTSFYQNFLNVIYRSNQHFNILSNINIVCSIFMAITLFPVKKFGYNGLLFYYLSNHFLNLILMYLYRPYKKIGAETNILKSLKELFKIGFPIFIYGYLHQISKTFNRLILISFGSIHLVGVFAPASAIFSSISFLPGTVAQFLYPKFSYLYGKHNNKLIFVPYVRKIYLVTMILFVPSIFVAIFILPFSIRYFLPEYKEGIFSAQLFFLSGVINISSITINIFYSIGNKISIRYYTIIKLILMLTVPLILLIFYPTLQAVSIGTFVASILISITGYFLLSKTLNENSNS